jgi:hypothetical protein
MAEPEKLVLGDKSVYPSEDIIFSIIGDKKIVWQKIMNFVNQNYKEITEEWRYYNDGKQWLFKIQLKKKTIFWIGVLQYTFRITFYFGNKAEPIILNSNLPEKIKDDFVSGKKYGNIRAITIRISGTDDLDNIYKLIDLKAKIK